eukprot:1041755-Pyramimonas_sp.AAC.2
MASVLPSLCVTTRGCGCEICEFYSSDKVPLAVPWALLILAYSEPPSVFECSHGRAPTDGLGVGLQPLGRAQPADLLRGDAFGFCAVRRGERRQIPVGPSPEDEAHLSKPSGLLEF